MARLPTHLAPHPHGPASPDTWVVRPVGQHIQPASPDPFFRRWRRRAFTFPLVGLLFLVGNALYVPLLLLAVVADLLRPRNFVLSRTLTFFLLFLWCEAVGVFAAFSIWVLLGWNRERFLTANSSLQAAWNRALQEGGFKVFGMTLEVEGDAQLAAPGPLLVLTRHVSTVDAVLPVSLLRRHGAWTFRFVLKDALLSDPCLDLVGNRLPNVFARRNSGQTGEEVARVLTLLHGLHQRDAVVVFPEGTRFTAERRAKLIQRARDSSSTETLRVAQDLQETLPPLTAGTLALLGENPGADVVVMAHTGLEAAGGFPDFIRGGLVGAHVKVKVWRIPFAQVPQDAGGQADFLVRAWQDVDNFIQANKAPRPTR